MKLRNIIVLLCMVVFIFGIFYYAFQHFVNTGPRQELYVVDTPSRRSIEKKFTIAGFLDIKELMKIGSLVGGVVEKMFVKENDRVTKGQLLATIDDGRADTIVRATQGQLNAAQADLTYLTAFLKRQEILFQDKHISQDEYEKTVQQYQNAAGAVVTRQAQLDAATLEFNNKKIIAPNSGIVIQKVANEGETVTVSSPPTLLYVIAKDITEMVAKLEIHESIVGQIPSGAEVIMKIDTYPGKRIIGKIQTISQAATALAGTIIYYALVPVNNDEKLFRSNMSVSAEIIVGTKRNVLSLPAHVFKISAHALKQVAQAEKMGYKPIDSETMMQNGQYDVQTVWVLQNNTFIEKVVKTGITDNAFVEIIEGINENDQVVIDVVESDIAKEYLERAFGKWI